MERENAVNRIHRKIERTAEEQARLDAARARFQAEQPGIDDLVASGEYSGPVSLGLYQNLVLILSELKRIREKKGLSLADVAERSGIDRGAISRLENGHNANPTIDTLGRYAAAVGAQVDFTVVNETMYAYD